MPVYIITCPICRKQYKLTPKDPSTLAQKTFSCPNCRYTTPFPTLIKEYNKHAWVSALKENYSLLNQSFKKMMADDGVEFIEDTEVWSSIEEWKPWEQGCDFRSNISSGKCKDFFMQLNKYFKIIQIARGNDDMTVTNGSGTFNIKAYKFKYRNSHDINRYDNNLIYLSNGAMIFNYIFMRKGSRRSYSGSYCDAIHAAGGHMCDYAGYFNIDVNGNRGPNEFGKDIFRFYITERGQLAPFGGNDYAIYSAISNLTQENIDKYKANDNYGGYCDNTSRYSLNGIPSGYSCTGLLIDQLNWKMDY